jgi:hypothetical protein
MSHSGSFYTHTEWSSRRKLETAVMAIVKPLLAFSLSVACSSILQHSASAQSKPLSLSTMDINGAEVMDLSFLKQLAEERRVKR